MSNRESWDMDIPPYWHYSLEMNRFIFIFLFTPFFVYAEMKALTASMHGERMAIEYSVLNTGKHILTVKEKIGSAAGKALFKQQQVVDLALGDGEVLAIHYSFRCVDKDEHSVYAIVSKARAREKSSFEPERAWSINEKKFRLDLISDPKLVRCSWWPEGEGAYPFR